MVYYWHKFYLTLKVLFTAVFKKLQKTQIDQWLIIITLAIIWSISSVNKFWKYVDFESIKLVILRSPSIIYIFFLGCYIMKSSSQLLQANPEVSISLKMAWNVGKAGELEHLQMNPEVFPGHLSWSSSSEQCPCPQDKQLQSSSQFILGALGKERLSRRAKSKLPGCMVASWIPVISVMLFPS